MRVLLLQTAVGDYRQFFLEEVVRKFDGEFSLFCGDHYFDDSLVTKLKSPIEYTKVNNFFFFNKRFLLQFGVFREALDAEVLVLELNPRILTNWFWVVVRKILGKKTVFWGHAWPRLGAESVTDRIRDQMRRLADVLIVYTNSQRAQLIDKGYPAGKVFAAPNSIYRKNEMLVELGRRKSFIYVGRLVAIKKILLAINAFSVFLKSNSDAELVIVGDGPLRHDCESLVDSLGIRKSVVFCGHISDPDSLKKLYSNAVASISPGYAGLSLTQSFGFGVPMIVSENEPHAPEIEAAHPGFNCVFFKSDDYFSLANAMTLVWSQKELWQARSEEISIACRNNYSAEAMAERFVAAIQSLEMARYS